MSRLANDLTMTWTPCTKDNSVLESDLKLAAEHRMIEALTIHETEQGYYLTVKFGDTQGKLRRKRVTTPPWLSVLEPMIREPGKTWYLTSRKHRTSPRLHKSLGRLNQWMRANYPTDLVILLRNQHLPGNPKVRGRRWKPSELGRSD